MSFNSIELNNVNTFFQWATYPTKNTFRPNIRVHMSDHKVTLFFDAFYGFGKVSKPFISTDEGIPMLFRPVTKALNKSYQTYSKIIKVISGGKVSSGLVEIESNGIVSIYATLDSGNFSDYGLLGWNSFEVTYMVKSF